eukprot:GHVP01005712.1.p1 GENE.GHVP01005712.1~~GHVP01005712.1.p1  ORF type:complete len:138 (+),score=22.20 GHVP01005712.1:413-826(+)
MKLKKSAFYQFGKLLISNTSEGTLIGVLDSKNITVSKSSNENGSFLEIPGDLLLYHNVPTTRTTSLSRETNKILKKGDIGNDKCISCERSEGLEEEFKICTGECDSYICLVDCYTPTLRGPFLSKTRARCKQEGSQV